jgi:hypothetical protein
MISDEKRALSMEIVKEQQVLGKNNIPNYKTHDPRGWCGDPKRGAALGRCYINGEYDGRPMVLQHIRLDSGGYDVLGTYWGLGERLYWAASQNGEVELTFRANNRDSAKAYVRGRYPEAKFMR